MSNVRRLLVSYHCITMTDYYDKIIDTYRNGDFKKSKRLINQLEKEQKTNFMEYYVGAYISTPTEYAFYKEITQC